MTDLFVVGVDPGPTPGTAYMHFDRSGSDTGMQKLWKLVECGYFQCDAPSLPQLVSSLFEFTDPCTQRVLAVEKFVVGSRSGRVSTPQASELTRNMVGSLEAYAKYSGNDYYSRPAGVVKPWATNERLVKAGFGYPRGMPHATDAMRHCLFSACSDGGIPDPLSKGYRK